jgi:hypothetical protein
MRSQKSEARSQKARHLSLATALLALAWLLIPPCGRVMWLTANPQQVMPILGSPVAPAGGAAPTIVQKTYSGDSWLGGSAGTFTFTITSTASGNYLLIPIAEPDYNGNNVTAVSDSNNDTFTEITAARALGSSCVPGTNRSSLVWGFGPTVSGITSIKVTLAAGHYFVGYAYEITGVNNASPVDAASATCVLATANPTGPSVTTTVKDLIVGLVAAQGSGTLTGMYAGNPFTLGPYETNGFYNASAYYIPPSTGTYQPRWADTTAQDFAASTVAIK